MICYLSSQWSSLWVKYYQTTFMTNVQSGDTGFMKMKWAKNQSHLRSYFWQNTSLRFHRSFYQWCWNWTNAFLINPSLQIVTCSSFTILFVMGMVLYLNLQLAIVVILSIPVTYFGTKTIQIASQTTLFKQQAAILKGKMNDCTGKLDWFRCS